MDADDQKWITINGTHVPVDGDGNITGNSEAARNIRGTSTKKPSGGKKTKSAWKEKISFAQGVVADRKKSLDKAVSEKESKISKWVEEERKRQPQVGAETWAQSTSRARETVMKSRAAQIKEMEKDIAQKQKDYDHYNEKYEQVVSAAFADMS